MTLVKKFILALSLCFAPVLANAADGAPTLVLDGSTIAVKGHLTTEQKAEKKAEFEKRLAALSPEGQARFRADRKAVHAKIKGQSKAERKAVLKGFHAKYPALFPAPVKIKHHRHAAEPVPPLQQPQ